MSNPKIDRGAKILSVSHNDLDGSVCQIILGQVYNNITLINRSFYDIDKTLLDIDYSLYDHVIITDIHPNDHKLINISDKIILIDHHKVAMPIHDPSKFHYVMTNKCAAVYVKRFVEALYKIDLSYLDNLVYVTNDYDMYTLNNPKSVWLNDLMMTYKCEKFISSFYNGRTRFTEKEMEFLRSRRDKFDKIWDNLDVFELDKFKGCIIIQDDFMNEVATKLMKKEGYRIVFIKHPKSNRLSIRHNIESFDVGAYLRMKGWGGGHEKAAGMFMKDEDMIREVVSDMEEYLSKNHKEV